MPGDRALAHRAAALRDAIELDAAELAALTAAGQPEVPITITSNGQTPAPARSGPTAPACWPSVGPCVMPIGCGGIGPAVGPP
jgi:hypothetical protein